MRKASYLAELELRYCYALNCARYTVGDTSLYMQLLIEYIDGYFDKSDVVDECRPYLSLLSESDCQAVTHKIGVRVRNAEKMM